MRLCMLRGSSGLAIGGAKLGPGDVVRVLAMCLMIGLVSGPALARRGGVIPIALRIVGYLGSAPAGVRPDSTWILGDRGRDYHLHIVQLIVQSGGLLPGDIDAALSPYRYRLQVAGDRESLARLRALGDGQRIVINGHLRLQSGARYLMLSRIEAEPVTPSPAR